MARIEETEGSREKRASFNQMNSNDSGELNLGSDGGINYPTSTLPNILTKPPFVNALLNPFQVWSSQTVNTLTFPSPPTIFNTDIHAHLVKSLAIFNQMRSLQQISMPPFATPFPPFLFPTIPLTPFMQNVIQNLTINNPPLQSPQFPLFMITPIPPTSVMHESQNPTGANKARKRKNSSSKAEKLKNLGNKNGDEDICLICDEYLPAGETAKSHLKNYHDYKRPIRCGCCHWFFSNQETAFSHRKMLTNRCGAIENPLILNKYSPGFLLTSVDTVNREYEMYLIRLGEAARERISYFFMTRLAKESETPPDYFTCNSCGQMFCSLTSLHRHRDNHYHTSRKCLLCNLFLSEHENSRNHLLNAHNIQRPMTCRCCDWIFLSNMEYCHHRMFLKGTRTDSSYPLVLNEYPPGFHYGEESKWLDEPKEILVKWQMQTLNKMIPSNSPIFTASSSETVSPVSTSSSRAPATKKGFMIKDILGSSE